MTYPSEKKAGRKQLSANALIDSVREGFEKISAHRPTGIKISLTDVLMSAFAIFSLKDPSLLAFDRKRHNENHAHNLRAIFHIENIPCDTAMREILDPVDPETIRPIFGDIFRALQRGKALEQFQFNEGAYLLSLDGTGCFSSHEVYCPSCLEKQFATARSLIHIRCSVLRLFIRNGYTLGFVGCSGFLFLWGGGSGLLALAAGPELRH